MIVNGFLQTGLQGIAYGVCGRGAKTARREPGRQRGVILNGEW